MTQFRAWFEDATAAGEAEPEAVAVATATPSGEPSVRFVLLRGVDDRGFVFYTNSRSRKGLELAANPRAALAFRWALVGRQVRVEGPVTPVAEVESDAYFETRARGSQLGAWASDQSRPAPDRAHQESRLAQLTERFEGQPVPRPPWWYGYRVAPVQVEFWQNGENRLHDRFRYRRRPGDDGWEIERLDP